MIVFFQAALAAVLSERLRAEKAAAKSQGPFSAFFSEFAFRLNHLLVRDISFTYGKQGTITDYPLHRHIYSFWYI
jgi:hypothetical protein